MRIVDLSSHKTRGTRCRLAPLSYCCLECQGECRVQGALCRSEKAAMTLRVVVMRRRVSGKTERTPHNSGEAGDRQAQGSQATAQAHPG